MSDWRELRQSPLFWVVEATWGRIKCKQLNSWRFKCRRVGHRSCKVFYKAGDGRLNGEVVNTTNNGRQGARLLLKIVITSAAITRETIGECACVWVLQCRFLFSCDNQFIQEFNFWKTNSGFDLWTEVVCSLLLLTGKKYTWEYNLFSSGDLKQWHKLWNWTRVGSRVTFDAFVLLIPASKLLAFWGGDVGVEGTIHYRRDHTLKERETDRWESLRNNTFQRKRYLLKFNLDRSASQCLSC